MYRLNTKIRLTILCLSDFELCSRWVPLPTIILFGFYSSSLIIILKSVRKTVMSECSEEKRIVNLSFHS